MSKNVVIVESPAKAKTIEGYLGKDYRVVSSFGHIRDLPKKKMSIDIEHGFKPTYEVPADKKDVIDKITRETNKADTVYLASDYDREGEAIAWHLKETLPLKGKTIKRIVFKEITKNAILAAIDNSRDVDQNLVDAQQARRVLDRLVGFELSPILWKKIKTGLSAGRVQSVAVRLVVDREREIEKHASTSEFKIVAEFDLGKKKILKAELNKKFKTEKEAEDFLKACIDADFTISGIKEKLLKKSPQPPFTTSTLQQEASRVLGYSLKQTMRLAQKLYEAGLITYMRTDSLNLSEEAIGKAAKTIESNYGKNYVETRHYKTKSAGAQEAHEAIRPTDFGKETAGGDAQESKLYHLIWRRAIASQMAEAEVLKTTATIAVSTRDEIFTAEGEVVKFDGFLKVYAHEDDDEEKNMLPPLNEGQKLDPKLLSAKESFNKAAARYTEATLVKKLEDLGIGRPSTYAPTISTIQDRGYIVKETREGKKRPAVLLKLEKKEIIREVLDETFGSEKNKLFPTNIAMVVNDFLVEHFADVVDFNFTKEVEDEFDEIAEGKKVWNKMIAEFYTGFHEKVVKTEGMDRRDVPTSRELGKDPVSGKKIIVRLGKFGPLVQRGEKDVDEKIEYASLENDQFIETLTLEDALKLFLVPKSLGVYQDFPIDTGKGRFGPYLKWNAKFFSVPKDKSLATLTEAEAVEIIIAKEEFDKNKHMAEFTNKKGEKIEVLLGRFGPYIKYADKNYKIPKTVEDPKKLKLGEIEKIIEEAIANPGRGRFTKKK